MFENTNCIIPELLGKPAEQSFPGGFVIFSVRTYFVANKIEKIIDSKQYAENIMQANGNIKSDKGSILHAEPSSNEDEEKQGVG